MSQGILRGTNLKRIRVSGFRSRMKTKSGRRIIYLRRKKGRNKLAA